MIAAYAARQDPERPLDGLRIGVLADAGHGGFTNVRVRACALNHHDLWTLRGYGVPAERLPMVLGTDAAGTTDDGREVIVHAVVETAAGRSSLLSERFPGTLAETVAVPERNLIPKPPELSFEDAACLPTSYLTAYNMLFGKGELRPGEHVLIQGAGGGVSTAAILIAVASGLEVTVCSRDDERRARAQALGAHHVLATGAPPAECVDAVLETVGAATFAHSLRAVRKGGRVIVAGATSGFSPPAELELLFMRDVSVLGTYMGTQAQLGLLARFMAVTGVRPLIDSTWPLRRVKEALARMADGAAFGKLVVNPDQ